jgi:hypothetical protein
MVGMRNVARHWYWWLPAVLVAAGLGYVGYRMTHPPWEGTEAWEKYQQIRVGMTRQEVDAILGERAHRAEEMTTRTTTFTWRQGEDRIVIDFFERGGRQ